MSALPKVVVVISGRGSNLQSIIDQTQAGALPVRIAAVISNCADAYGLVRAQELLLRGPARLELTTG